MPILARQSYSRLNVPRLQFFSRTFSVVFNCRSLFNEAAYLAALRRLRSPFAIRDANSKQSKTKIYEKPYLLLRISAVIGSYGPYLMIVMIFETQNTLKTVQEFPTVSLDLTDRRTYCSACRCVRASFRSQFLHAGALKGLMSVGHSSWNTSRTHVLPRPCLWSCSSRGAATRL